MTGPWISTRSGRKLYFDVPTPDAIDIGDIACAEANICRFTGQIDRFYSVAEHSWHCSYLVPKHLALCALLHDGTEPYVNDLASPLKGVLSVYKAIEETIWTMAVAPAFGLPETMPIEVKRADIAMFQRERIHLQPWTLNDPDYFQPLDPVDRTRRIAPANVRLRYWGPRRARRKFLARYYELTGRPTLWGSIKAKLTSFRREPNPTLVVNA